MIVADIADLTGAVFIVKTTEDAPLGIITEDGTVATVDALLERAIAAPPGPAVPLSVTVPTDEAPPVTRGGLSVSGRRDSGFTVKVADCDVDPWVPVIVTVIAELTVEVAMAKLADEAPEGIVTLAGTVATALLDARDTAIPPDGAGPLRTTLPVEDSPPTTVLGETDRL